MFRRIILSAVLVALIIASFGCNTVQGLGEDIKWTGEKGAEIIEGK